MGAAGRPGGGAPSRAALLALLLCAAPRGLLGEEARQVSLEVLAPSQGPPVNLLHVRAVGADSSLHFVWSSLGPPAALLVATDTPHSTLRVNWSLLLSPEPRGGLLVLPEDRVQFASALVFTRLLEFDSTDASSSEPLGKPHPPYQLAEFSWSNISDSLDPATLSATFRGHPIKDPSGAFANGSLAFRVQAFSGAGRPDGPPRLLHTANTSQVEVVLAGASPRGNRSLFGLEVAVLGRGPSCPSMREQRSIDDEYAPTFFQLDQLLWDPVPSGFMQWRPVAFSRQQRDRESALPCHASALEPTVQYSVPQSPIVWAFFGSRNDFCAFNLTFGTPTGPGYWDQNYLSWSTLLGVGTPPLDALSPLILSIMVVALGAPALILLGGGLFLLLGPRLHSKYQSVN